MSGYGSWYEDEIIECEVPGSCYDVEEDDSCIVLYE